MIVRKVAFEKTIGMPNYSNDRPIVVEADLEPGETKEQAWTRINQDMIAWHKKEYPHLYQEEKYPQPFPNPNRHQHITDSKTPMEVIYTEGPQPADTFTAIQSATSLEDLKSYKLLASGDKTLYEAYCTRIKELAQ